MNYYMLLAWDDYYPEGGINDLISTIEAVDHASAREISLLRIKDDKIDQRRDEWQLLWIDPETVKVVVIGNWLVEDKFGEPKITEK